MSGNHTLLLLEDEPVILMDLEFAAEDRGCTSLPARDCDAAFRAIESSRIDIAVLDVSLGGGATCMPVAEELDRRGIPYLLHSADLDRQDEQIHSLDAQLISKPAPSDAVIDAAIALLRDNSSADKRFAAE